MASSPPPCRFPPCSTPLASGGLPTQLSYLPQYDGRGVLGWITLMDGSTPAFTADHIDLWGLNLYYGRNFSNTRLFELYDKKPMAKKKPLLITEYGVDSFNMDSWYESCVVNNTCADRNDYGAFVDPPMQADWLLRLVEDLERHSATCEAGCASKTVSGGSIMAWVDETWKGRVIDSIDIDVRSSTLACPEGDAIAHSLCGYPNAGQPDTFVNEEWFGLNEVVSACTASEVDQIAPRLAWYGLRRLWSQGGCTPHVNGSGVVSGYDVAAYPDCGGFVRLLHDQWLDAQGAYIAANASDRAAMTNAPWLRLLAERSAWAVNGDGDCTMMQLLHDFDPSLCPAAPEHLRQGWVDAHLANTTVIRAPSECPQNSDVLWQALFWTGFSVGLLCLLAATPNWLRAIGFQYGKKYGAETSRLMKRHLKQSEAVRRLARAKLAKKFGYTTSTRSTANSAGDDSTHKGTELSPAGGRSPASLSPSAATSMRSSTGGDEGRREVRRTFSEINEPRRNSMVVGLTPNKPPGDSAELKSCRALLDPIAARLAGLFGFQTMQPDDSSPAFRSSEVGGQAINPEGHARPEVRSNAQAAVEHVSAMLAARVQRLDAPGGPPRDEQLRVAVYELHEHTLGNYRLWKSNLGLSEGTAVLDAEGTLCQLMLWYLIWGEAANLRHMPECLCLVLYTMSNALQLSDAADERRTGRPGSARSDVDAEASGDADHFDMSRYVAVGEPISKYVSKHNKDTHSHSTTGNLGGFPTRLRLPKFRQTAQQAAEDDEGEPPSASVLGSPGGLRSHHSSLMSLPPTGSYEPEDFLGRVVSPLFRLLEQQISVRAQPGKGYSSAIADRAMYDDVNEFFWRRENVDRLLDGKATTARGYAALRTALARGEGPLSTMMGKTFYEHPSWLSVFHTFDRVFLLNALAMHIMTVLALTQRACEAQAEAEVPDAGAIDAQKAALEGCLHDTRGPGCWRALAPVTVTHAAFQLCFFALESWLVPSQWHGLSWRALLNMPPFVIHLAWRLSCPLLLLSFWIHTFQPDSLQLDCLDATKFAEGDGVECGSAESVFQYVAALYALCWVGALLRLPLPLPGFTNSWGGVAPQWMTKPPLTAALCYVPFWIVVLALKWSFEYFGVLKPLALPTIAIWQADFSCWETGHTGTQPCVWAYHDSNFTRGLRDLVYRLMLIGLRWSIPLLLVMSDLPVFYLSTLAVSSVFMGRRQGIGVLQTWADVVTTFFETQVRLPACLPL